MLELPIGLEVGYVMQWYVMKLITQRRQNVMFQTTTRRVDSGHLYLC